MPNLITTNQTKMLKSGKFGYLSAILNLAPATTRANGQSTCPFAGQCKAYCLQNTGRNYMSDAIKARARRLELLDENPAAFKGMLLGDIWALVRKAEKEKVLPTMRLNGLSDIDWALEMPEIFEAFPMVQFIDYTKDFEKMFRPQPENYHLTFSISERTKPGQVARIYEETRFNCAMVFHPTLPDVVEIDNIAFPVISGDESDLRHLDDHNAIVGLKFKKPIIDHKAVQNPKRGFVVLQ